MTTTTVRRLDELNAAPYNPRKITSAELDRIANSLQQWGMVSPLVVNVRGDVIIGGHQRAKAAEAIGLEEVPVIEVDLDDDQAKALNLALNKLGGDWDKPALEALLADLQPHLVELAGFDPDDLVEAPAGNQATLVSFAASGHAWTTDDHHRIRCPHEAGGCVPCARAAKALTA